MQYFVEVQIKSNRGVDADRIFYPMHRIDVLLSVVALWIVHAKYYLRLVMLSVIFLFGKKIRASWIIL